MYPFELNNQTRRRWIWEDDLPGHSLSFWQGVGAEEVSASTHKDVGGKDPTGVRIATAQEASMISVSLISQT